MLVRDRRRMALTPRAELSEARMDVVVETTEEEGLTAFGDLRGPIDLLTYGIAASISDLAHRSKVQPEDVLMMVVDHLKYVMFKEGTSGEDTSGSVPPGNVR